MSSATPAEQDLRYPVGRLERKSVLGSAERHGAIDALDAMPAALRAAVEDLTVEQLDTPYRPSGWTVRQLVHHLADSHMNAYTRFKLALTEENPTVKPYDEKTWAELHDSLVAPVETSVRIVESVHARLVQTLRTLAETTFARTVHHPDNGSMTIDSLLTMYAWHGRHHVAQVTALRERMGWA